MVPPQRVLVTASTGRVGKAAVAYLKKMGGGKVTIRACVRGEAQGEYLKSIGADEVAMFDLKKRETWNEAIKGCDAVFSSSMDSLISEHMEFAKFLGERKDEIKHVVRISCFGADTNTNSYNKDVHSSQEGMGIPLMLQHYWWSEECLINAGLKVTSIRGNFYMNHLLKNETENIQKEGKFSTCLGECKNSFVCTNDMGEVAATCLMEGPAVHANKFYDITGPEAQSMHEVATDLGTALNKTITYCPQDFEQFKADFGPTRAAFFEYLRNGFYTRCSPDFYNITGKKATPYREYLTTKGPFGETGLEELFSASGSIFKKGEDQFKHLANISKD
mmetsp:Transcript_3415/g.3982  ORF Transcript_3415/g.3982 Transcript_3415/m.3982 type:complete len:333 (-) Transcript_3415:150-1148(-)